MQSRGLGGQDGEALAEPECSEKEAHRWDEGAHWLLLVLHTGNSYGFNISSA